jgi:hypothetical protein
MSESSGLPNLLKRLSNEETQARLAAFNAKRFTPALPNGDWRSDLADYAEAAALEGEYLDRERERIKGLAESAPINAVRFVAWFEELKERGPGQRDPLFPWLAEAADIEQMKWFLTQEVAGEAGFEDLTALTQVRLPSRPKLELARNYWDEMGRGQAKGMHGPMLAALASRLELEPTVETTIWESLSLANTMAGLAANRRYAYHSIGALGAVELTAPDRAAAVAAGLKRLGVRPGDRHYFDLHSTLDVRHSRSWNAEAIGPLVEAEPAVARAIAEGALMRLECGRRCFERYRREFGLNAACAA